MQRQRAIISYTTGRCESMTVRDAMYWSTAWWRETRGISLTAELSHFVRRYTNGVIETSSHIIDTETRYGRAAITEDILLCRRKYFPNLLTNVESRSSHGDSVTSSKVWINVAIYCNYQENTKGCRPNYRQLRWRVYMV